MALMPPPIPQRPRCPGCDQALKPTMTSESHRDLTTPGFFTIQKNYRWTGSYRCYGAFCTLRCSERYANTMFTRHGTRFSIKEDKG